MNNVIEKKINVSKLNVSIARSNKLFGFWLYLMSDCIVFATLFSVYMVMKNNIANGPSGREIFNFSIVVMESLLLLFSSFSYSFVLLEIKRYNKNRVIFWFLMTFLLGTMFLMLETFELVNLIQRGYGPTCSGFLSAFFVLLSTHGIHVVFALLWILVIIKQVVMFEITHKTYTRILCLSLFWHFLDIVWIFIFSIVYLIGVIL
ncbi:MAG: cytochrome o ubiquinol oxidase subunit III [Buchnera aphidicola (Meitanaphis elongallis)]